MRNSTSASGTQSASKALALLRCVGAHHPEGARLTDLIALTGQDRSTAHRLLACLSEQGFVERAAPTKAYRLGLASVKMGLVSSGMAPIVERFRPLMLRVARQSGDAVFLMVRSADHTLCLHREEGSYPIKALTIEPGAQRLLGISLVGVAMLAQLPDAEVERVYARHAEEYRRHRVQLVNLRKAVLNTRRIGFSQMTDHTAEFTRGVGCAIRFSRNSQIGISICAINSRMPAQRRRELGAMLCAELNAFAWQPAETEAST